MIDRDFEKFLGGPTQPVSQRLHVTINKENVIGLNENCYRQLYVLSYRDASPGNKLAAERVWQTIQAKQKNGSTKLKLVGVKVISSTKTTIQAAITEENQRSSTTDLEITMENPMVSTPAPGSQIDIIGVLTGYTPQPFVFKMNRGELH